MLKKILATLGALVAVLLAIPMVLPSKMELARSIELQLSAAVVHAYLVDLNHYSKWDPFSETDPSATSQVTGSGMGSIYTWKGEKTGEGKMIIAQIQPDQSIQIALEFYKPMPGVAQVEWKTEALDAEKTRVTWSMVQELPYLQRYFSLFMNGMLGKMFDQGLSKLKTQLEQS